MKKQIHFCGRNYNSKASLVRRARAVRDDYEPNGRVKEENEHFVLALLLKHPDYQAKVGGREVSHFEVRGHKFQTRAFYIVFVDRSAIDFSFMKSINAIFDEV